jgi:hypothetical protein
MQRIALALAILTLALPSHAEIRTQQPKAIKRVTPSHPIFVLIHSPLVGSMTWQAVADEMPTAASWSLCQVLSLSNARAFRFGSSTPKA